MKSSQRFDYRRLADSLVERGLIDYEAVDHVLNQCAQTGYMLPEVLVQEDLISDWEVARVACELYHLPFLPAECYPPAERALEGLDRDFMRQYALVPADRFGRLLIVIMPALVPTEILEGFGNIAGAQVLPVVGSVTGNRRWLNEHMPAAEVPEVPKVDGLRAALPESNEWASIFDAGEEAVQLELSSIGPDDELGTELDLELSDRPQLELRDQGDSAADPGA